MLGKRCSAPSSCLAPKTAVQSRLGNAQVAARRVRLMLRSMQRLSYTTTRAVLFIPVVLKPVTLGPAPLTHTILKAGVVVGWLLALIVLPVFPVLQPVCAKGTQDSSRLRHGYNSFFCRPGDDAPSNQQALSSENPSPSNIQIEVRLGFSKQG